MENDQRAALAELVALEDLREQFDAMKQDVPDFATAAVLDGIQAEYQRRKPAAWAAARAALTDSATSSGGVSQVAIAALGEIRTIAHAAAGATNAEMYNALVHIREAARAVLRADIVQSMERQSAPAAPVAPKAEQTVNDGGDVKVLESAVAVVSRALDDLVGACTGADDKPCAPDRGTVMRARSMLPPACKHALKKTPAESATQAAPVEAQAEPVAGMTEREILAQQIEDAHENGLHDARLGVQEVSAGFDDLPFDGCPETWCEKPFARLAWFHDHGDSSVGQPSRSGWTLGPNQDGTVIADLVRHARLLADAKAIIECHAGQNTQWTDGLGRTQDPLGAHAWLSSWGQQ